MRCRAALVDDEPIQFELIKNLFQEYSEKENVTFEFLTFESAEAFLFYFEEDKDIDLLVLDIEMDGMNGMELAKRLRQGKYDLKLLFVTGYTDYIAEGYEVSALDYVLKPIDKEKLFRVLDRFRETTPDKEVVLFLETADETIKVNQRDIVALEASGHYTTITTVDGSLSIPKGMGTLQKELQPEWFVKTHRSYIANLAHIEKISKKDVHMDNGTLLPVSRRLYKELNQAFIQYYKERLRT